MKHDFRLERFDCFVERGEVADVGNRARNARVILDQLPEGRGSRRLQRVPAYSLSERLEPHGEPGSLEPRVAADEDVLTGPEFRVYHFFHGGSPLAQSSSRWFLSRSVSIGCQNPRWK